MKWALVDGGGIVLNTIAYEEDSDYSSRDGYSLIQINDWINIGQNIDTPEPSE